MDNKHDSSPDAIKMPETREIIERELPMVNISNLQQDWQLLNRFRDTPLRDLPGIIYSVSRLKETKPPAAFDVDQMHRYQGLAQRQFSASVPIPLRPWPNATALAAERETQADLKATTETLNPVGSDDNKEGQIPHGPRDTRVTDDGSSSSALCDSDPSVPESDDFLLGFPKGGSTEHREEYDALSARSHAAKAKYYAIMADTKSFPEKSQEDELNTVMEELEAICTAAEALNVSVRAYHDQRTQERLDVYSEAANVPCEHSQAAMVRHEEKKIEHLRYLRLLNEGFLPEMVIDENMKTGLKNQEAAVDDMPKIMREMGLHPNLYVSGFTRTSCDSISEGLVGLRMTRHRKDSYYH
ncbi:hypothetical protein M501DRAFT_989802 [Patellaria atrata CBS 101060]|uniref:Uncharacterized protein n=1 Tax=Patellaria atrata CBS 101060 TaxID=1346257 RepID=A0A9P4SF61_9PEZI|nr:hypothetical protein M501DRAFT_989802 [Patellaria atrata CBS 101060]